MKPFQEITASSIRPESLQEQLGSSGYVLIRDLIPRDDVRKALASVTNVLADAGWLLSGHEPLERIADQDAACGDPDLSFKRTYQEVFNLELFHALPHHPALEHVMKLVVGEHLLIHPKPIGRLIFPHRENLTVHAHQDHRFMDGDPECFTVWIPLHDCPIGMGPLQILEGSHRFGVIDHEHENLHVPEIPAQALSQSTWVGGQIDAGDVLIFHSLTVHAASPNRSDRIRISLDCRFQDYRRAIHPGNLAFAGESQKAWEKTYAHWCSDDLKYYWKRLPLHLQPSRCEIEQLSKTAELASTRSRYARILSQLN